MVCEAAHRLTPQEAKDRLRMIAADTGPVAWTREHPLQGVTFSFLLGVVVGGSPEARRAIQGALLRFVLGL